MKLSAKAIYQTTITILILLNFILPPATRAQTHWLKGIVTAAPYQDKYRRLGINDKLYTFMPEASVYARAYRRTGDYDENPLDWQRIRKGHEVMIDVQGRRIYQLVVIK